MQSNVGEIKKVQQGRKEISVQLDRNWTVNKKQARSSRTRIWKYV